MKDFGLAVWAHDLSHFGSSPVEIKRHAARLQELSVDILVPCVKNDHGAVDFLTDRADVNPAYPEWDPLSVLVDSCHDNGVKVHPWFCVFKEGPRSKLRREHPDVVAKVGFTKSSWSPESSYVDDPTWACACREDVQRYVLDLYEDLGKAYRPDGLHLDYIRTGGPCRCDFCKEQMSDRGIDIEKLHYNYPVGDPAYDEWTQWRASKITGFVRELGRIASPQGIELSAAVSAKYPECVLTQAQDWVQWAEEGIIDYLFPMNYTSSLRIAVANTVSHVALIRKQAQLWEGLGVKTAQGVYTEHEIPGLPDPGHLLNQIRISIEAGADGVALFQYADIGSEEAEIIKSL